MFKQDEDKESAKTWILDMTLLTCINGYRLKSCNVKFLL